MSTLLLRLAGAMQSWGTQSRFTERDSGREPSKSGVVGLLCAAEGRSRGEVVDDLAQLRLGVRVDAEGTVQLDYQTAGGGTFRGAQYGVATVGGKARRTALSHRYYLADADFLVGLEGQDDGLLRRLHAALREPHWQLCLGRKAFVPGIPVWLPDGLKTGVPLLDALRLEPWPRAGLPLPPAWRWSRQLRFVLEDPDGPEVRHDQPYGAAFQDRTFAPRNVRTDFWDLGREVPIREDSLCTSPA
ncbi:MAG: type I-E CRISPR-associated protein Cas5/CasD [Chloroflexi bacterium]|nr:type I-E CRISPR-associated protein Cas5/CasD [Chloroflexota bacterium]